MEKFTPIPKAKQRINNLLKSLQLKPEYSVESFLKKKKHLYSTKCIDKNGKAVFIKVILDNKKRFFNGLTKEGLLLKYLTENQSLSKNFNITGFLQGNLQGGLPWFTQKFIKGKILGEFYEIFEKSNKHIQPLITNLTGLHSISGSQLKKIRKTVPDMGTVNASDYKDIIQKHEKQSAKLRKLVNFKNIKKLFEKQYWGLKKAPIVLTQGDFTFANQLIAKEKIYLLDWEWARLDNFSVDLAHMWIQSWRYPKWQSLLLKTYLQNLSPKKQEIFKQSFKIVSIVQALNELRWNVEICPEKYKKEAAEFCLKVIKES